MRSRTQSCWGGERTRGVSAALRVRTYRRLRPPLLPESASGAVRGADGMTCTSDPVCREERKRRASAGPPPQGPDYHGAAVALAIRRGDAAGSSGWAGTGAKRPPASTLRSSLVTRAADKISWDLSHFLEIVNRTS